MLVLLIRLTSMKKLSYSIQKQEDLVRRNLLFCCIIIITIIITNVLLLAFITTVWKPVVLAIINII